MCGQEGRGALEHDLGLAPVGPHRDKIFSVRSVWKRDVITRQDLQCAVCVEERRDYKYRSSCSSLVPICNEDRRNVPGMEVSSFQRVLCCVQALTEWSWDLKMCPY